MMSIDIGNVAILNWMLIINLLLSGNNNEAINKSKNSDFSQKNWVIIKYEFFIMRKR